MSRRPLHRQVQDAIRDYIVSHQLAPGDRLPPEGELATLLGISRNSVREGVKALEVQGVVEARVGAGLFVRSFSFDPILESLPYSMLVDLESVGHLLSLREVLDLGVADRLVTSATGDQVETLRSILDKWREEAGQGTYPAHLDREFHQVLYSTLDNPLLSRLAGLFWDTFRRVADTADVPDVADPAHTLALHEEILRAVEAGDVALLRTAVSDHYPGVWSELLG